MKNEEKKEEIVEWEVAPDGTLRQKNRLDEVGISLPNDLTFYCHPVETMIWISPNDKRRVSELKVDDLVLQHDSGNQEFSLVKVKEIRTHQRKTFLYTINDSLKVTHNHPIFTKEKGYERVQDLHEGNHIIKYIGKKRVKDQEINSIRIEEFNKKVYSLSVSGNNSYFAEDFKVHNKARYDVDEEENEKEEKKE